MATRTETRVVYAAGVVQGIALVTFPALSTVFTDPDEYGLSSTEYGALFLPQVIAAITAALLGGRLSGRFGLKRVYLVGSRRTSSPWRCFSSARYSRTTPRSPMDSCCWRPHVSGPASASPFRR